MKMTSFSGLGLGLSLVFGCLLLALVAELYYLLWRKKKRITDHREIEEDDYGNFAKELFQFICWKKNTSNNNNNNNSHAHVRKENPDEQDPELGCSGNKDHVLVKPSTTNGDQEGVESELMRLHNLAGPPRFLFTIKEETKEDMESEDGRSRKGSRTRSLSDLMVAAVDTTFLTPLASPHLKSSPLKNNPVDCYKHHGFNPLFESSTEADQLSRLRSSPPPKFKFLRDAEEKLYRRLKEEAEKKASQNSAVNGTAEDQKDGSFFTFMVGMNNNNINNNDDNNHLPQFPSSSSQVLPLASSPTAFKPDDQLDCKNKSILH